MKRLIRLTALIAFCLALVPGAQPALAQSGNMWQVDFYNNQDWAGAPAYTTSTNFVNFNWGNDTPPAPNMPAQFWTARFSTQAYFYPGMYTFQIVADDEFVLYIDGALFADTRGLNTPGKAYTIPIAMTQGNHTVVVDYRQYTAAAYISVNWVYAKDAPPPAPPPAPGPPAPPPPAPAGQLVTDFGDYTACAQQQIHQKNCFQANGAWNAPNAGSIAMEPQIILWSRCTPDEVRNRHLWPNKDKVSAKCSKTEAGWFQN